MLPAQMHIEPYEYHIQITPGNNVTPGQVARVRRKYFWHSSFGKGAITSTGLLLQPNTLEKEFMRAAPYMDTLDPNGIYRWYTNLVCVCHDHGR